MNDAKPDVASPPAKLLPCPFCGGTIHTYQQTRKVPDNWAVRCEVCGGQCGPSASGIAARYNWNLRALTPAGEGGLDTAAIEAGHVTWRSMQQCADSWLAVVSLLHELVPDWAHNSLTGQEAALAAIRRLATTSQPGSSVQGDAVGEVYALPTGEHRVELGKAYRDLPVGTKVYTTPPPAPAAEQGVACGKCGVHQPLQHSPDCGRIQPEARGVEGMDCLQGHAGTIVGWWRDGDFLWATADDNVSELMDKGWVPVAPVPPSAAYALPDATPNPVRAEKPEGKGALDALRWYAEQVELCRKLGAAGDKGRQALDADGGKRARDAIAAAPAAPGVRVDEAMARRLDDYLGGEFDIRIGKQAAHAALTVALAPDGGKGE